MRFLCGEVCEKGLVLAVGAPAAFCGVDVEDAHAGMGDEARPGGALVSVEGVTIQHPIHLAGDAGEGVGGGCEG